MSQQDTRDLHVKAKTGAAVRVDTASNRIFGGNYFDRAVLRGRRAGGGGGT